MAIMGFVRVKAVMRHPRNKTMEIALEISGEGAAADVLAKALTCRRGNDYFYIQMEEASASEVLQYAQGQALANNIAMDPMGVGSFGKVVDMGEGEDPLQ